MPKIDPRSDHGRNCSARRVRRLDRPSGREVRARARMHTRAQLVLFCELCLVRQHLGTYIVLAVIVTAYIVTAYIVMAYIVVA